MAKDKDKEAGVYRIVDVIGVSTVSWEDAAKRAVETAGKSLRDLRIAEVTQDRRRDRRQHRLVGRCGQTY
jgi:flavin-binding protein dodecin